MDRNAVSQRSTSWRCVWRSSRVFDSSGKATLPFGMGVSLALPRQPPRLDDANGKKAYARSIDLATGALDTKARADIAVSARAELSKRAE